MNDIDVYVCLFEECETPEEMYTHSSQWLKHMREHALSWRCDSKAHGEFVVTSREDYIEHLRTAHQPRLTDTQLRLLADKSSRASGKLFDICPLCGFKDASCSMEEHIVGDLRLLALKSLPVSDDGSPEDPDSVSAAGSALCSRSTVQNFMNTGLQPDDISWGTVSSRESHSEDGDVGWIHEMQQDPAVRAMLSQLDPEQRQKFRQLPPDKLYELFSKWKRTGMLSPGQSQQVNPPNITADVVSPLGNTSRQSSQREMESNVPSEAPKTLTQAIPMRYTDSDLLRQELDQRLGRGSWECKVSQYI